MLWEAYSAIEPWGKEVEYAAKLLTCMVKSSDWNIHMPDNYQRYNNPLADMSPEEEKANDQKIARSFQGLAEQIAAIQQQ